MYTRTNKNIEIFPLQFHNPLHSPISFHTDIIFVIVYFVIVLLHAENIKLCK